MEWLSAWSARNGLDFGLSPRTIADKLSTVSYAELEDFANDVRRRSILSGPDPDVASVTRNLLRQWSVRAVPAGEEA